MDGWTGQITWEKRVGAKRLTIVAQPFLKARTGTVRWAGLAIEAPAEADTISEILSNHSHKDLGDFESPIECIIACDAYIKSWLDGHETEPDCLCKDIVIDEAGHISPTQESTPAHQDLEGLEQNSAPTSVGIPESE